MITIGNIYLPFDILSKIFRMLPQKNQLKLREVCGDFKRLVDHAHYINKGFVFVIKNDSGPNMLEIENIFNQLPLDFHYAPPKALGVFKIFYLIFGNLLNDYESQDLKLSHPESVNGIFFGGYLKSMNFSIILKQLTHLGVLTISNLALKNLQQEHLSGFNFNNLEDIILSSGEYFKNTRKIKTLLTGNEFPKLETAKITLSFKSRPIRHNKKITPKEDYEMREKILFPFLKKCQQKIEKFDFGVPPFRESNNVLDFTPVEEDENLNLEEYKIFCPNLRVFKYPHLKGAKIDPWITFLDKNFNKLESLQWVNKSDLQEDHDAFYNLIKSQKWVQLKILTWENHSSIYMSEVDFIFLKNYEFLRLLEIRNFPTGIGENWNFKNLKLIPNFCPALKVLILGRCRMNSDIVDHLLTGNKLPNLRIVKFLSEWRGIGNGMRVDTFRKVVEEKKIEYITLMDCIDNESFGQDENKHFIISQIGQVYFDYIKELIQNWQEIEFYWKKADGNNHN